MSSSDDLSDTSSTGLFNWASDRITEDGWEIPKFLRTGIGLTIAGIFVGIQDVYQSIIGFVTNPLDSAGESVATLFAGLVGEPASILTETASATATGISTSFTGLTAFIAFPLGVASVMGGLWIVTVYLEERETSDLFPGSFTDIDTPDILSPILPDPGVQEEGETDESRD